MTLFWTSVYIHVCLSMTMMCPVVDEICMLTPKLCSLLFKTFLKYTFKRLYVLMGRTSPYLYQKQPSRPQKAIILLFIYFICFKVHEHVAMSLLPPPHFPGVEVFLGDIGHWKNSFFWMLHVCGAITSYPVVLMYWAGIISI